MGKDDAVGFFAGFNLYSRLNGKSFAGNIG